MNMLRTPAGTAAARQRTSTFSYERLMSRSAAVAEETGDEVVNNDQAFDDDRETRLMTTISKVTPLLMTNIGVLADNATGIEEKCLALDELLYLVEGAWSMPVVGREVAYHVCDVLRDEGGLDVLLSNISGRTSDAADNETDEITVLMSAIVLSQVG